MSGKAITIAWLVTALLGPVFARIVFRVGDAAEGLDLRAYQTTFEPLLYGVGLAMFLALLLKETGPAARRLGPAEALS